MSRQEPIVLFPGVEILPNLTIRHATEYLRLYCTLDTLGDTLYVKKIGNDKTTYAIDFDSDEMDKVRKIKDENGNNLDDAPIFENDYNDDEVFDQ